MEGYEDMTIKRVISNIIFYITILIVTLSIYMNRNLNNDSAVLISNLIIIVLSLFFMTFGDNYNYSLNKIFFLFSFFFFGVAPLIQYKKGIVLWSNVFYSQNDYYKMNLLILFILISYQFFYFLFSKLSFSVKEIKLINYNNKNKYISNRKVLLLSIIALIMSLYVYKFNVYEMLIRGGSTILSNKSTSLIYSNFIRPIPVISLFIFKYNNDNNKYIELLLWFNLLLTNFPLSAARFYIASLYIPILIIYIDRINSNYLFLNKLLIFGILIIFPYLDQVRRLNNINELSLFSLDFKMFSQGHFDSYQMFMFSIKHRVLTHGKQLLTALFFFIPRSVWPGKSVGSGTMIANNYGFFFDNISMNFFGEGYINFGYVGIILFIIGLSYFNARYDKLFWTKLYKGSMLNIFYCLMLGLLFFLLRGDMLSSIAFITGIFTSVFIVNYIVSQENR